MTLAEVSVALALAGILVLLVAQTYKTDLHYHGKLKNSEVLEKIQVQLEMVNLDHEYISKIEDSQVTLCLLDPCSAACKGNSAWKPLALKDLAPVVYYRPHKNAEQVYDGAYYTKYFSLCQALPKEAHDDAESKPRYPPECYLNIKALGRFRAPSSFELRITTTDVRTNLKRVLIRKTPLQTGSRANLCSTNKVLYCNATDSFILSYNFKSEQFVCANPESELNYEN